MIMKILKQSCFLLCIAAVSILGVRAAEAAQFSKLTKPPLSERWFGIYVDNERAGFYHQTIAETAEGYRMEGDGSVRVKVMGFSKEASSREVYRVGKGLVLRSFDIEQNINGVLTRLTGTASESVLRVRSESNGKITDKQIKLKGEIFPGPALNLYPLMRGVPSGKTCKILTFDPEEIKVKEVKIKVLGEEKAPDGQAALKLQNNLYPFVANDIWMDGQGNTIVESVRDGLVMTRAEDPKALAAFVGSLTIARKDLIYDFSLVRSVPALKNQAKLSGLSIEISGWNDSLPLLQEGGQVIEKAGAGRITVRTGTAVPVPSQKIPVTSATVDQQRYLVPAEKIESDAPEIVSQAKKIAEGKAGRIETARAIAAWTTDWLKDFVDDGGSALASLASRTGNCQTHARLYTALARAAGIPTRFVSGLVALEGKGFLYHSWAESFLDGRWVAVDPTYNQLPADPTHLKFFEGHTQEDLAPIISIIGKISIKVLDALY
ncbi:MAG: transglutaminase domain-containing protein [Desulfuromonadales bacterium]|nr:transglutaminase domain-containing protein [Desulfuromonadales bacterium]